MDRLGPQLRVDGDDHAAGVQDGGGEPGTSEAAAAEAPAKEDPEPAPAPTTAAEIEARLDTVRLSPSFTDTPLKAVMQFFRDVSGCTITIDPGVFEETPEDALRVNLEVTDVIMRDAFELILDMVNLGYVVRDGAIVITTK